MVLKRQARGTAGELEPLLIARNDTDFFDSGLDKARNVVSLPEGGWVRRPGFVEIATINNKINRLTAGITITAPNGGDTTLVNDGNESTIFTTTNFVGTNDPYVIVHYDLGSQKNISYVDAVDIKISAGEFLDQIVAQGSNDNGTWEDIGTLNVAPTGQTFRRAVFKFYRYIRLIKFGPTDFGNETISLSEFNVWESTADLSDFRLISYRFNIEQQYVFVFGDRNIDVYKDKVYQISVRAVDFTENFMRKLTWTSNGDVVIFFNENVMTHKMTRNGADNNWIIERIIFQSIPLYNFTETSAFPAATLTPSGTTGKVTLTASANVFSVASVNQLVYGNGGKARIVSYTSDTVVEALIIVPFYNTSAIAANDWLLEGFYEPIWSDTRGWPKSGTFWQQRLLIGGSKSRPRTIAGSVLGQYFNFDQATGRDTDAINFDLDTDEPVVNLLSHRSLQIFTTGNEYTIALGRGIPLTQLNAFPIPQTELGSEEGIKPLISNGVIMFIQNGGGSVVQLVYDDNEQALTASNVTVYSSHLIRSPLDFAIRRSTNTQNGNLLLVVNTDGTMACGTFMREEEVKAFTLWETQGSFKAVCVSDNDIYVGVTRFVNGVYVNFLEVSDDACYTDCAKKVTVGAETNVVTGLGYLEGATVSVRADSYNLDNAVVTGGQITTSSPYSSNAEVGFFFRPTIKTLPFEKVELVGDRMGTKKRISKVTLRLYETTNIKVNGNESAFQYFNEDIFDTPPVLFTGDYRFEGLLGWDDLGQVEITQDYPGPMTLLAIAMEADV